MQLYAPHIRPLVPSLKKAFFGACVSFYWPDALLDVNQWCGCHADLNARPLQYEADALSTTPRQLRTANISYRIHWATPKLKTGQSDCRSVTHRPTRLTSAQAQWPQRPQSNVKKLPPRVRNVKKLPRGVWPSNLEEFEESRRVRFALESPDVIWNLAVSTQIRVGRYVPDPTAGGRRGIYQSLNKFVF